MKQFVTTMQYVFAAMGGAIGAVLGGFDGFLYALIVFVVDRSVAIGRSAKNPNVLNNVLVNKTKAAKNGAIILLDPQVWYLSGGGIISLNKMISEVEAAFTDKK